MATCTSKVYLTCEELQDVTELAHNWSRSYDFKDWKFLRTLLANELDIDYRKTFLLNHNPSMPADDFVAMLSNPGSTGLGSPSVRTQHLLGAPRFEKLADGRIDSHWLIRAAHYDQKSGKQMYSHAVTTLRCRLEDGVWKICGVTPHVNWEVDPADPTPRDNVASWQ